LTEENIIFCPQILHFVQNDGQGQFTNKKSPLTKRGFFYLARNINKIPSPLRGRGKERGNTAEYSYAEAYGKDALSRSPALSPGGERI